MSITVTFLDFSNFQNAIETGQTLWYTADLLGNVTSAISLALGTYPVVIMKFDSPPTVTEFLSIYQSPGMCIQVANISD